jgi:hypothetical protein
MFGGCALFNQPVNFTDTSKVTNMGGMFFACSVFNQPVNFYTGLVTNMFGMFHGCTNFNQSVNFTDTSKVTNMGGMFHQCSAFNQPVNFNTSHVTNMQAMFNGCSAFNQSVNFNTYTVKYMSYMFTNSKFNGDISMWEVHNVTNMYDMFRGSRLTELYHYVLFRDRYDKKDLFKKIYFYASRSAPYRSKKDPYWKKYYSVGEGYNYLMPHLLGAVGRAQIEKFPSSILKKKIEIGKRYRAIFKSDHFDFTQKIIKSNSSVFWLNSIKFKNLSFSKVCQIGESLSKKGIEVRSGFWPLSKLPGFNSIKASNMKNSINIFNKILVLPSNINLTIKDLNFIFLTLNSIIEKIK